MSHRSHAFSPSQACSLKDVCHFSWQSEGIQCFERLSFAVMHKKGHQLTCWKTQIPWVVQLDSSFNHKLLIWEPLQCLIPQGFGKWVFSKVRNSACYSAWVTIGILFYKTGTFKRIQMDSTAVSLNSRNPHLQTYFESLWPSLKQSVTDIYSAPVRQDKSETNGEIPERCTPLQYTHVWLCLMMQFN